MISKCTGCADCTGCDRCTDCTDCTRCTRCTNCTGCTYCFGCDRCTDCDYCDYCVHCVGLYGARHAKNIDMRVLLTDEQWQAVKTVSLASGFSTAEELVDKLAAPYAVSLRWLHRYLDTYT